MELNFVHDCHHVSCIRRAEHTHVDVIEFFADLERPHIFLLMLVPDAWKSTTRYGEGEVVAKTNPHQFNSYE